ncbi:MAG: PQQ-dependent sugar dehydrogenase [Bacteroidota bacterium]
MIRITINLILLSLIVGISSCDSLGSWERKEIRLAIFSDADLDPKDLTTLTLSIEGLIAPYYIDTLNSFEDLVEANLRTYSALIIHQVPLETFPPQAESGIKRYLEGGGGLICLQGERSNPYAWPWLSPRKVIQSDSLTPMEVKDTPIGASYSLYPFKGGRIALSLDDPDPLGSSERKASLQEALRYTIGNNRYYPRKITSLPGPDASRFTKVILDDQDVNEPMELSVLPDGKVLFIERRGKMKLYDPAAQATRVLHSFDVCTEGNYEDGLLGLELDPNFEKNRFFYLYYSPPCQTSDQYLSRFVLDEKDSLWLDSEKVVLKVAVQRETCCHSGGSISFGPKGNLFLSTGDNTSSKESDGFSPLDERPGRGPFDAQKSSGNTHDLRGKVLRIKVLSDGSYEIPEGNLFPPDGSQGRPEIYVMGARNPFRISIDAKTGFLYWGDVGPDGTRDGKYGPQSYDEFNQAREAGNFGWPFFVGDNKAYRFRDFAADTVGEYFDPLAPANRSPNNTGAEILPPAQPAFIWYSKRKSKNFPHLGRGSNSAMAGPIYYADAFAPQSPVKFPEYYNGKLFIYEWARSWINVVEMDEAGDIVKIEPFLPNLALEKPIDMEFGPDGAMYILEYGKNYFLNNPEAKLARIEYVPGNRLPTPVIDADRTQGAAPLTVKLNARESYDLDPKDSLQFEWEIPGLTEVVTGKEISHTFQEKGIYEVMLRAIDNKGAREQSELAIHVGNTPPAIQISWDGNRSFYLSDDPIPYQVMVSDPEDEAQGGTQEAKVQWAYFESPEILMELAVDPTLPVPNGLLFAKGKRLIEKSDCLTCHARDTLSVGPSHQAVAAKYSMNPQDIAYLTERVSLGGNGVWGEKMMPGHPQHTQVEIEEMVKYILSLKDSQKTQLGSSGAVQAQGAEFLGDQSQGVYVLSATYRDKGSGELPPIPSREFLVLKNPKVEAEAFTQREGWGERAYGEDRGTVGISPRKKGAYLMLKGIDFRDIKLLTFRLQANRRVNLSFRLDSPEGPEIGRIALKPGKQDAWEDRITKLKPTNGIHSFYLVVEGIDAGEGAPIVLDWVKFGK